MFQSAAFRPFPTPFGPLSEGVMCMIAEIIHTCSHEKVAQAAVASMGSGFAGKVGVIAGANGLSIGAFTARAVREFEKIGGKQENHARRQPMNGSDQPILAGLQLILRANYPITAGESVSRAFEEPPF